MVWVSLTPHINSKSSEITNFPVSINIYFLTKLILVSVPIFYTPKMASQTTCCSYQQSSVGIFCSFSKIIINHHFSNASYLALLFFTGLLFCFLLRWQFRCDHWYYYYTVTPSTCMTTFEILLGNLEPRQLPTEKYGRTSFETYRDDFVISGYFHMELTYQGI
jgi:hypothetical protein